MKRIICYLDMKTTIITYRLGTEVSKNSYTALFLSLLDILFTNFYILYKKGNNEVLYRY